MSFIDVNDWRAFWGKIKWQLISFKFLSFWTFVFLLVTAWGSLVAIYYKSLKTVKELYVANMITQEQVSQIIINTQNTLFDTALSNILIFSGAILGSIIAIKGVSYWTNSEQVKEVIKKTEMNGSEDLKQFLPKNGK